VASQVVVALQTLVSREVPPLEPAVITVASLHAGTTFNVIPDAAELKGTVRTYSRQLQEKLERRINELVQGIARAMQAEAEVKYTRLYPPTINHRAEAELMRGAVRAALGDDASVPGEPVMGAEDFSYLLERVPGAFGFLGVRKPEWSQPRVNHNSSFDMDESALPFGTAVLASTALHFLGAERPA
jgi:amidohydrolase